MDSQFMGTVTSATNPPNDFPAFRKGPVVTDVPASVASVTLLNANSQRKPGPSEVSALISNASSATLYVLYGVGAASPSNFTYAIPGTSGAPAQLEVLDYQGPIQGCWDTAVGQAVVNEFINS